MASRPVKTATFGGVRYLIFHEHLDGLCEDGVRTTPLIYINSDIDGRNHLETCLHESDHACNPSKPEHKVTQDAKDQARFLWRLGYRRTIT